MDSYSLRFPSLAKLDPDDVGERHLLYVHDAVQHSVVLGHVVGVLGQNQDAVHVHLAGVTWKK
jgi:hypothetical protein